MIPLRKVPVASAEDYSQKIAALKDRYITALSAYGHNRQALMRYEYGAKRADGRLISVIFDFTLSEKIHALRFSAQPLPRVPLHRAALDLQQLSSRLFHGPTLVDAIIAWQEALREQFNATCLFEAWEYQIVTAEEAGWIREDIP